MFSALDTLQTVIVRRLDELHGEMNSMTVQRDLLENEIKSYSLEREIVGQDLVSLERQVKVLKEDKAVLESKCTQQHLDTNESIIKELDRAREQIKQLQSELMHSNIAAAYAASYKEDIARLESELSQLNILHAEEAARVQASVSELTTENTNYKRLCEHLKTKIKELSKKTEGGRGQDKEFLDTFEEVDYVLCVLYHH